MFYKALGFVVWKLAMQQLRQRFGGYRKPAAGADGRRAIAAIYVATRDDE